MKVLHIRIQGHGQLDEWQKHTDRKHGKSNIILRPECHEAAGLVGFYRDRVLRLVCRECGKDKITLEVARGHGVLHATPISPEMAQGDEHEVINDERDL